MQRHLCNVRFFRFFLGFSLRINVLFHSGRACEIKKKKKKEKKDGMEAMRLILKKEKVKSLATRSGTHSKRLLRKTMLE